MTLKEKINNDLFCTEITDIINEDIFYIHKEEELDTNCYIEWEFISNSRSEYAGDEALCNEALIQIDVFANIEGLDKYYLLEELIPTLLENKGYDYYDDMEEYEEDTYLYHRGFRFNIKEFR